MSKIALSPNAAGTGVVTLSTPNTNNDRTLALPDSSGTIATLETIPDQPSHWTSLADVTLGTSTVNAIEITLPTGYDVLKLEVRFPINSSGYAQRLFMKVLEANGGKLSYSYHTNIMETSNSDEQVGGQTSNVFTMSPAYGNQVLDYCFYNLYFYNTSSTTKHTIWQGQGQSYANSNSYGTNLLSSGIEYNSIATASANRLRFEVGVGASASFATDNGCYYRLYGHTYS